MEVEHMYAKSANMFGDELENNEDFSFAKKNNSVSESIDTFNQYYDEDISEEHIFECQMISACSISHLQIIAKYLESHDVNNFLNTGWTPLLYAAFYSQEEAIRYLITNGANVNKHQDGYTPLMALCSSTKGTTEKRIQCLNLLIEAKANANVHNREKQTPLMYACRSQESEFIKELLKHCKNINACDNRKKTALMYATVSNKLETIKILLENGADVTLTDDSNLTARDIASVKGYDKSVSLLNFDEEEIIDVCETSKTTDWTDMFPSLCNISDHIVDFDIYTILYGMGLEKYAPLFQGMSLKNFLKLTENDLLRLGVTINAHRVQFMEQLHKFHRRKWTAQSIGIINKSLPYSLCDGIVSLGTIAKQISVIGCSFQYINSGLLKANNENVHLTEEQVDDYEQELKKAQKTLCILQKELVQVQALSKKIEKDNDIGIPPTYLGPKKPSYWTIILTITVATGICLFRTAYVQRLIET